MVGFGDGLSPPETPTQPHREKESARERERERHQKTNRKICKPPPNRLYPQREGSSTEVFGHSDIGLTLADIPLVLSLSQERLGVKDIQHKGQKYRDSPMMDYFVACRVRNYGWEPNKSLLAHAQPLCGPRCPRPPLARNHIS